MLDSPFRIFRCFICVENHLKAPLQDLSLLVEHLAEHFGFHLFECRICKTKFATPFLANFHIRETSCMREEGEIWDEEGPLLNVVNLETVEFSSFCDLQNAVTKCTELMLHELQYGEEDLLNCSCFVKKRLECPASPEPIIREERHMQTSPPVADVTSSVLGRPWSKNAVCSETACTMEKELAEGCCFVSDDEEQVQENAHHKFVNLSNVVGITAGYEEASNSTVSTSSHSLSCDELSNSTVSTLSQSPSCSESSNSAVSSPRQGSSCRPFSTLSNGSPYLINPNLLSPDTPPPSYSSQLMIPEQPFDFLITKQVEPGSSTSWAVPSSLYRQSHTGDPNSSALNQNTYFFRDFSYPDLLPTYSKKDRMFGGNVKQEYSPSHYDYLGGTPMIRDPLTTPSFMETTLLNQEREFLCHRPSSTQFRGVPIDREQCVGPYNSPCINKNICGFIGALLEDNEKSFDRFHSPAEDVAVRRTPHICGEEQKQHDIYSTELAPPFRSQHGPVPPEWKGYSNGRRERRRERSRTPSMTSSAKKRSRSMNCHTRSLRTHFPDSGDQETTQFNSSKLLLEKKFKYERVRFQDHHRRSDSFKSPNKWPASILDEGIPRTSNRNARSKLRKRRTVEKEERKRRIVENEETEDNDRHRTDDKRRWCRGIPRTVPRYRMSKKGR